MCELNVDKNRATQLFTAIKIIGKQNKQTFSTRQIKDWMKDKEPALKDNNIANLILVHSRKFCQSLFPGDKNIELMSLDEIFPKIQKKIKSFPTYIKGPLGRAKVDYNSLGELFN